MVRGEGRREGGREGGGWDGGDSIWLKDVNYVTAFTDAWSASQQPVANPRPRVVCASD